jgi:hypothetical protein
MKNEPKWPVWFSIVVALGVTAMLWMIIISVANIIFEIVV